MPANVGRKPSYQHRDRNTTEPDIVVDRIEKSTSGNSQHCTTPCTISFRDPRATAEKEFELYHRKHLPKSISKCQGNCGRPIKVEEVMVVRSYGRITWTDKSAGEEKANLARCTYTSMRIISRTSVRHSQPPANHLIFFKKEWPKDTRKTYGSRQNIAVAIGNKVKFQKTIFYSLDILSNFL